jgi:hypothetical protein
MTDTEMLQARIQKLETALVDYIARFGLSEVARKAMVGVRSPLHATDAPSAKDL